MVGFVVDSVADRCRRRRCWRHLYFDGRYQSIPSQNLKRPPTAFALAVSNVQALVRFHNHSGGRMTLKLPRAFACRGILLACLILVPYSLRAQPARTAPNRLKVFIDCMYECDTEYLRQNI